MKYIFSILLLVFSMPILAGYSGSTYIEVVDEYDNESGLYFKAIVLKIEKKGLISNGNTSYFIDLNIFDPKTEKNILVFNDHKLRSISRIIFESDYDSDNESMVFGGTVRTAFIKNNRQIKNRKPKDKILIFIFDKESNSKELWTVKKTGQELKKIKSFDSSYSWHIDVKNSKIRIIGHINNALKVESLEW